MRADDVCQGGLTTILTTIGGQDVRPDGTSLHRPTETINPNIDPVAAALPLLLTPEQAAHVLQVARTGRYTPLRDGGLLLVRAGGVVDDGGSDRAAVSSGVVCQVFAKVTPRDLEPSLGVTTRCVRSRGLEFSYWWRQRRRPEGRGAERGY